MNTSSLDEFEMPEQLYIEFENAELIRQTEMAGLFEIEDQGQFWIPWSQVSEDSIDRDGQVGSLFLTEWICAKKEIEY